MYNIQVEFNDGVFYLKFEDVNTNGRVFLAPMAGCADRAFRELCKSFGAAFVFSEMVSAKGVSMGDNKSKQLMLLSEIERPAGVQIFGSSPQIMAQAAVIATKFSPEVIDINMGCPAPKIIKGFSGSALMKNPSLAGEIVKEVSKAVSLPVTVKIRAGWDNKSRNAVEIAQICEENGAAAITIHGRTQEQMYSPPVDYEIIRLVKEAVNIPVIGNGDVNDALSAEAMFKNTGCDYIMVGRGALGRPWIFNSINEYLNNGNLLPEPSVEEKMSTMLRHIEKICEYIGETAGTREARKHAVWYTKGLKGSAAYRRELCMLDSIESLIKISGRIINDNQ